jgi:hypothetical protein
LGGIILLVSRQFGKMPESIEWVSLDGCWRQGGVALLWIDSTIS